MGTMDVVDYSHTTAVLSIQTVALIVLLACPLLLRGVTAAQTPPEEGTGRGESPGVSFITVGSKASQSPAAWSTLLLISRPLTNSFVWEQAKGVKDTAALLQGGRRGGMATGSIK
ncbi:hypothetical protein NQZ68_042022 [Dissostichus eleginoides]|nr:hypothetical protein NQZ68_042022 [Dissostichus eleginoides]